ncbi:enoyl-CoA hydratase/isomerase family protein [Sphingobium sp. HBC34]|uniref:Enoyl-CoA hydratase/isomerase family protein n=1 Tax=Sphingobium cyanobacteriorum TaxID=3063954 RepID=A0ABT8ZGM1_9SPHN|nr:enoyl-CoA hydratase/isomerase family protein [Sphingobium sp. HBC34]MDO7833690.1 enoyl-CoA hydratase/isomerase family protein [Sphingobium sp. HBC34]
MMRLTDYQHRYDSLHVERSDSGGLTVRMHTRGGEALWGIALNGLHRELGELFADIARDDENRVVILTATGDTFCAHMDMQAGPPETDMALMWERVHREGVALLDNLLRVPVPMIAAINGPAHIHAELPLLCDIVLAADTAEFADIAHVAGGVVPGDGVQAIWPMLLGPNRGRYFLLTGQKIGAAEALALGIVGEVLAPDALMDRARSHADRLAALPLPMLRRTRTVLTTHLRARMEAELSHGLMLEAFATLIPRA